MRHTYDTWRRKAIDRRREVQRLRTKVYELRKELKMIIDKKDSETYRFNWGIFDAGAVIPLAICFDENTAKRISAFYDCSDTFIKRLEEYPIINTKVTTELVWAYSRPL